MWNTEMAQRCAMNNLRENDGDYVHRNAVSLLVLQRFSFASLHSSPFVRRLYYIFIISSTFLFPGSFQRPPFSTALLFPLGFCAENLQGHLSAVLRRPLCSVRAPTRLVPAPNSRLTVYDSALISSQRIQRFFVCQRRI